jgi:hypothetical protein
MTAINSGWRVNRTDLPSPTGTATFSRPEASPPSMRATPPGGANPPTAKYFLHYRKFQNILKAQKENHHETTGEYQQD